MPVPAFLPLTVVFNPVFADNVTCMVCNVMFHELISTAVFISTSLTLSFFFLLHYGDCISGFFICRSSKFRVNIPTSFSVHPACATWYIFADLIGGMVSVSMIHHCCVVFEFFSASEAFPYLIALSCGRFTRLMPFLL